VAGQQHQEEVAGDLSICQPTSRGESVRHQHYYHSVMYDVHYAIASTQYVVSHSQSRHVSVRNVATLAVASSSRLAGQLLLQSPTRHS